MQRHSVVVRQVFHTDFGPPTLLLGDECGFGRWRGARLGFTGGLDLPLEDGFPVLCLLAIKFLFPLRSRYGALGAMVTILVAPRATVGLDVVEELALGIIGDFSAVDSGGRVGTFKAGREVGGLLVSRAGVTGRVLAGLELVPFLFAGREWVAFVLRVE
jgi:hypothetical protein